MHFSPPHVKVLVSMLTCWDDRIHYCSEVKLVGSVVSSPGFRVLPSLTRCMATGKLHNLCVPSVLICGM